MSSNTKINLGVPLRYLRTRKGYNTSWYALDHKYIKFWEKNGFNLIIIPNMNVSKAWSYIKRSKIKGILLPGLANQTEKVKRFDRILIRIARNEGLPIIGICSGMWSIAEYFGEIVNRVRGHDKATVFYLVKSFTGQRIPQHKIKVLGHEGVKYYSNTYHKYELLGLPPGFEILMVSGNTIEGISHRREKIIAVQWHPERDGNHPGLLDFFIEKVRGLFDG